MHQHLKIFLQTSVALATESSGYVWSRTLCAAPFPPPPSPPLPLLIFDMYFMQQPSSLLYNHQTLILRFFPQTDRRTDWPTEQPTDKGRHRSSSPELKKVVGVKVFNGKSYLFFTSSFSSSSSFYSYPYFSSSPSTSSSSLPLPFLFPSFFLFLLLTLPLLLLLTLFILLLSSSSSSFSSSSCPPPNPPSFFSSSS